MLRISFLIFIIVLQWLLAGSVHAQAGDAAGVRMVEVDGLRMRVQAIGLENRRPGAPVVIFEAGATNSLQAWSRVIPEVARMAPVVSYDRAGLGESDWDSEAPTPRRATTRLRSLLQRIGVQPPYVLVGHSWGGMLMHYFAGYHPGEVAGLVFVDPAPILTRDLSENLVPFNAIGAGRAGYDAYWTSFSTLVSRASPPVRAEFEMLRGLLNSELSERDLRPLPRVPVVVIVAAKYLPLPINAQLPFDSRAYFEADLRHRLGELQEWALASPDGLLLVSNRTTHAIPREAPGLVVQSVAHVLESASLPDSTPSGHAPGISKLASP